MKLNKLIFSFTIILIISSISLYSKNIEEIVVTGTKGKTQIINETGNLSLISNEEIRDLETLPYKKIRGVGV